MYILITVDGLKWWTGIADWRFQQRFIENSNHLAIFGMRQMDHGSFPQKNPF